MEAMRGLFAAGDRNAAGATTLFVHANDAKQIAEVIRFKRAEDLERVVLVGGLDSWMMADPLARKRHRCDGACGPIRCRALPRTTSTCLTNCPSSSRMRVWNTALQGEGRMPEMNTRNLPFFAGTAVAYGLEYEQAVRALTLSTAQDPGHRWNLWLVGARQGRHALYFAGDALDMMGNDVRHAWVQGRDVVLDNKQIQLYEKYKAKYDGQRLLEEE